jgi:acetate kinase
MADQRLSGPVLVVNAGSGSLKLDRVDAAGTVTTLRQLDADPAGPEAKAALDDALDESGELAAVGYRVVHGGPRLTRPTELDDATISELHSLIPLAPTHLPPILDAIATCRERLPDTRHVACFDTAFHAGLPDAARTYALPRDWRDLGIRRYGFHGVSYAWATHRAAQLLDRPVDELQLVLTHLGGGASVCAVSSGRSVWTSMGFTPLEGLPMVKRSGSVDPGILLWLQQQHGFSADDLADALQHRSGLTGLTGGRTGDTREIVKLAGRDAEARLALDVYTLHIRQYVAAATANLTAVDALVFTGEIGCDQPEVRSAVCAGLAVLGVPATIDDRQDGDRVLAAGPPAVLLVQTGEAQQVAHEVRNLLNSADQPA